MQPVWKRFVVDSPIRSSGLPAGCIMWMSFSSGLRLAIMDVNEKLVESYSTNALKVLDGVVGPAWSVQRPHCTWSACIKDSCGNSLLADLQCVELDSLHRNSVVVSCRFESSCSISAAGYMVSGPSAISRFVPFRR